MPVFWQSLCIAFRRNHFMDKVSKYLEKVDVLPMSPTLLPKLLPKLSDVDTNFDEVVDIISLDQSLTSKILQICNSAFFGQQTKMTSVAEAVNRVGYQSVYLLVAMINGSSCFPCLPPPGMDATKLWQHSLCTAFNSKFVAESAGLDSNLLFTAGLLHDLGKVILGQMPEAAAAGLFSGPSDAASLAREKEIFGCTHAEVGATLLDRWRLPAQLIVGVQYHHQPKATLGFRNITACITVANFVTHSQEQPQILERPGFKEAMDLLGLSPDHLESWQESLRNQQNLLSGMSRLPPEPERDGRNSTPTEKGGLGK